MCIYFYIYTHSTVQKFVAIYLFICLFVYLAGALFDHAHEGCI